MNKESIRIFLMYNSDERILKISFRNKKNNNRGSRDE